MPDSKFKEWSKKEYIPEDLKNSIINSDILIIPQEGFRNISDPLFPVGTEDLYLFLKEKSTENAKVEICISDEDYKELALHDDIYFLGFFLITEFVKPMFIKLIYDYMKAKISSRKKEENTSFKLTATSIKKDGTEEKLEFEGNIKEFEKLKEITSN